jgi:5'-nucleotidase
MSPKKPLNILLTNDDGISAEGINALFDALSEKNRVFMFAPHMERSACSNALTIRENIRVDKTAENKYAVHGYPADCVHVGINWDIIPEIDMVVSGINHGPNLGDDIHYSGTVAGARSGYIFKKKSIAVSFNSFAVNSYINDCADFLAEYIQDNPFSKMTDPYFLNINYPNLSKSEVIGTKITKLGNRSYINDYKTVNQENDSIIFELSGSVVSSKDELTDTAEIKEGYITVSPLSIDATDYHLFLQHTS